MTMPIDPNIILGIRNQPIVAQDPLEQYGKGLALKGLLGQQELQGLQTQQARQSFADEDAVRDAYRSAGGDNARLRALLQSGGQYKAIQALDKFDLEKREKEANIGKHLADTSKTNLDAAVTQIQHGASLLMGAKDQASYDAARRQMMLNYPQVGAQWPEKFDPAEVAAKIRSGMTIVQNIADARAAQTDATTRRGQDMTDARARERLTFEREQPRGSYDSDRGLVVDPRTGEAKPVTVGGEPIEPKNKLNESQGKAAGMALRAREAHQILNTLEEQGIQNRGIIKQGVEKIPLIGEGVAMGVNMLPQVLGGPSSSQQKVEQARRNFVNAVLRVESGASINESEFRNAEKQYFPMPGDAPSVVAQKRQNRETAIKALDVQSGPAAKSVVVKAPAPKGDLLGGVLTPNADGSFNYGFR